MDAAFLKFCKVPKSLVSALDAGPQKNRFYKVRFSCDPASSAGIGLSPLHIFDNNPKADVHRPLPRQALRTADVEYLGRSRQEPPRTTFFSTASLFAFSFKG